MRELARRHGVRRRAVRQALQSAIPPAKRPPSSRPAPKLGPYLSAIDGWLEAVVDELDVAGCSATAICA